MHTHKIGTQIPCILMHYLMGDWEIGLEHAHKRTHNNQAGSGALKTSLCDVQSSGICVHGERQRERRSGGERKKTSKDKIRNSKITKTV